MDSNDSWEWDACLTFCLKMMQWPFKWSLAARAQSFKNNNSGSSGKEGEADKKRKSRVRYRDHFLRRWSWRIRGQCEIYWTALEVHQMVSICVDWLRIGRGEVEENHGGLQICDSAISTVWQNRTETVFKRIQDTRSITNVTQSFSTGIVFSQQILYSNLGSFFAVD